ncbi:MurR/RpiR family transcriptional regulator [Bradyrhizobium sp. ISRA464]|uniref:MurR/RpiR family transcriptional regulator n=1 Tax=Bradyrhizobium sp. ISRA464 TaxID=2866200 RepID=UPI00247922C1|nr:MurR/RpiR family transcriptional regulator [Bradyrhizobium sp. ISRA464]WGS26105.1 MurR/RpiR family transcriptional regulator [Bradyrhizobium sp. ISRA464]
MTTVRETIRRESANLTLSERKIGDAVLADYPFGALQTIQELAERTGVSAPSITRFVGKLGFAGYQEFQRQLITEVRESRRSPLQLKATEKLGSAGSFLADYARRATERIHEMSASVPQEQFDRVLTLLADPNRAVFLVGGRISDNIAGFLSVHLKQIRPKVHHLPPNPEHWPDLLLSIRKQDVLVLFDFRRYQRDLEHLAEIVAKQCRPSIVLITDKWMSPIARHSDHVVALPIEIETAWDTLVCAIAFAEALIVKVSEMNWPTTKDRLAAWDRLRLSPPSQPLEESDDR